MRAVLVLGIAAALAACEKNASLYCDENDTTCPPGYYCETGTRICVQNTDGAPCDQTHPCMEPTPFCLDMQCVECGGDPDCADNDLPVCGPNNTCIGCSEDNDCDGRGDVCQPDGFCAEEARVIYTDPEGLMSGTCDRASPCDLFYAVDQVLGDDARDIIHLAPGQHDIPSALDVRNSVMFLGRGAEIRYLGADDNVIEIDTTAGLDVALYYVEITGGNGSFPSGNGIRCDLQSSLTIREVSVHDNDQSGLLVRDCTADLGRAEIYDNNAGGVLLERGRLTVLDSIIRINTGAAGITALMGIVEIRRSVVRINSSGGLDFTGGGPHVVENCLLIGNGGGGDPVGGAYFGLGSGHTFRFNTVVGNTNDTSTAAGVSCTTLIGTGNIFDDPVEATCTMNYSLFTTNAGTPPPAGMNVLEDMDPMFLNDTDPAMPDYYHLDANSPAVNAGEQPAAVNDDIDGDLRPSTSNPAPDMGADEVP
jgi:hypothetical protein